MSNAEIFIEEYKKLEEAVRRVYHLRRDQSIVTELKSHKQFREYAETIQSCADLRNFYQHDVKIKNQFIADVSPDAIAFIKMLTETVNQRKKGKNICTPIKRIYWRTYNDSVKDTMKYMKQHAFSHVPILDKGKVVAVFDESALFSYVTDRIDKNPMIGDELTIGDLKAYICCEGRDTEVFAYCSMNAYVDEVEELFDIKFREGKRLGLVLLTQNGKPEESLQGIITPWDLVGNS